MTVTPVASRLTLGLVGLLAACGAPPTPAADGDRRAIMAALTRYVAASNRGGVGAPAALYADDAVLLPPDREPIAGRQAIEEFWRRSTDPNLAVQTLRVDIEGDLAHLIGRYRLRATESEPADSGKYVMCLRRQRDGWKLTADIWNGSAPVPGADDRPERPKRHGTLTAAPGGAAQPTRPVVISHSP